MSQSLPPDTGGEGEETGVLEEMERGQPGLLQERRLPKWERKHIKNWYLKREGLPTNTICSSYGPLPFGDNMVYKGSIQEKFDRELWAILNSDGP